MRLNIQLNVFIISREMTFNPTNCDNSMQSFTPIG